MSDNLRPILFFVMFVFLYLSWDRKKILPPSTNIRKRRKENLAQWNQSGNKPKDRITSEHLYTVHIYLHYL